MSWDFSWLLAGDKSGRTAHEKKAGRPSLACEMRSLYQQAQSFEAMAWKPHQQETKPCARMVERRARSPRAPLPRHRLHNSPRKFIRFLSHFSTTPPSASSAARNSPHGKSTPSAATTKSRFSPRTKTIPAQKSSSPKKPRRARVCERARRILLSSAP